MLPTNLAASQSDALRSLHGLLRMSQVRVTRTTLRTRLGQHREFPSLRSLSDTLDDLRIRNSAVQIAPPQLAEIPLPALAYLTSEGGFFAPVRATTPQWVEWWHPRRGWQRESLQGFTQHWRGTVLLLEPTAASGELNYAAQRRQEWLTRLRVPFALLTLLACLGAWESFFSLGAGGRPGLLLATGDKATGAERKQPAGVARPGRD